MINFDGLVLVLGANGETGKRTVKALQTKHISVRAMVRDAEKAAGLEGPAVEIVIGSALDDADLAKACTDVRAVIMVLGAPPASDLDQVEAVEHTAVVQLIQAAKAKRVQQIVLCSSMGTETPDFIPPIAHILRAKRRGEQALEASGIAYTIVRPGGLINDPGTNEVIAQRTIQGFGRISRDDVAEVLVQAILQPEARNKIVEISSQPGAGAADRPDLFA